MRISLNKTVKKTMFISTVYFFHHENDDNELKLMLSISKSILRSEMVLFFDNNVQK